MGPGPRPGHTPQGPPGSVGAYRSEADLGLSERRYQPPAEELRGVRDLRVRVPII